MEVLEAMSLAPAQTTATVTLSGPARAHRRVPVRIIIGSVAVVVLVLAAILVPILSGVGINEQTRDSFLGASFAHPFGTDEVGRDVFVRAFYGLRLDLLLIVIAVPVSLVVGTALGMLRALNRGLGELGQRLIDIILGFPSIILGLSVAAIFGPSFLALLVAVALAGIPPFGRLARTSLLTLESRDFVLAAKAFGVPRWKIVARHYLPNSAPPLLTQLAISLIAAVGLEASMSVIGLGVQPPNTSLGSLISSGLRNVYVQVGYVVGPALIFMVLAVSLNLIADGLAERSRS